MSEQIVIEGEGHVCGKLASHVAKMLLEGKEITVVACEKIIYTGDISMKVAQYASFRRKRNIVNPAKGHKHYVQPSKMFRRAVKRMLTPKCKRGSRAFHRLTIYDSIPKDFENATRYIVPAAYFEASNERTKKHCYIGEVQRKCGWNGYKLAEELTNALKQREEKYQREQQEIKSDVSNFVESDEFKKIFAEKLALLE